VEVVVGEAMAAVADIIAVHVAEAAAEVDTEADTAEAMVAVAEIVTKLTGSPNQ
jgi:hypothetical protein